MNFCKPLVAAAAISALVGVAAPAQAFFLGATSKADGSFSFAQDTKVYFDFLVSHGEYQSKFGVYDAKKNLINNQPLFTENKAYDPGSDLSNDWKGTCPTSVTPCQASFTFLKGFNYFLGLTGGPKPVYTGSLTSFPDDDLAATAFRFFGPKQSFTYYTNFVSPGSDLTLRDKKTITVASGTNLIAVNDSWKGDADYNDFVVIAKKSESVPEPGTIGALLGVGALGVMSRRRRAGEAEKA